MDYSIALNRAASLCSQSEKAPQDIYRKALTWGLDEPDAERLVARLIEEHFIDEERYARAFVNDKFRFAHWGRVKVSAALRAKGIPENIISIAFDEKIEEEDYLQTCRDLLANRMKGMSLPLSQPDRARLFRFAAQRGFEMSVISRALSDLLSQR